MLGIERDLDALPGLAWRNAVLVWRAHRNGFIHKHKLVGCEVQIVERATGYSAFLFISAGKRWRAFNMKRGPWRWLYRRWVSIKAKRERANGGKTQEPGRTNAA